jgi:catechol 2,3-dioxygenase-like lactoylglutathione lyase family enzyme
MEETYGLTHLAILVRDINRTLNFYRKVFDVEVMYQEETWAQVRTPGCHDIIVFEQSSKDLVGTSGGLLHFRYRLRDPGHITAITRRVTEAGGRIRGRENLWRVDPTCFFTTRMVMRSRSGTRFCL